MNVQHRLYRLYSLLGLCKFMPFDSNAGTVHHMRVIIGSVEMNPPRFLESFDLQARTKVRYVVTFVNMFSKCTPLVPGYDTYMMSMQIR